jgi:hypothetical protein
MMIVILTDTPSNGKLGVECTFRWPSQVYTPCIDLDPQQSKGGCQGVDANLSGRKESHDAEVSCKGVIDVGVVKLPENIVKSKQSQRSKYWKLEGIVCR